MSFQAQSCLGKGRRELVGHRVYERPPIWMQMELRFVDTGSRACEPGVHSGYIHRRDATWLDAIEGAGNFRFLPKKRPPGLRSFSLRWNLLFGVLNSTAAT